MPCAADGSRGVYRSTDGGQTWQKTLYVDSLTGAQNIVRAFDHPDVILATTIERGGRRGFGGIGGTAAGGPGGAPPIDRTKLFKSTDEGVTWTEITGGGLPPLTGRLTAAVAMHTNAQRMFVIGPVGLRTLAFR